MTIRPMGLIFAVTLAASSVASARTGMESMYSNLEGRSCKKTVLEETTDAHILNCPAVGKFTLQVLTDDGRSTVNIVSPEKKVFELQYEKVVTEGFAWLGKKAEWRVTRRNGKIVPVALIVNVNGTDQTDLGRPKRVPLLAVAQIRETEACVVKTLSAGSAAANAQARVIADGPALPCLKAVGRPQPLKKG
ncbi:hypothetical protein [Massilia sp. CCM 8734]|uniref:hypothetical protein n=1 Tax=Massilia sp. CCM 8734 TaxID=2609283 RepID=UPI0014245AF3|nr:hypothetical protein [Massilia sp. CCM 8734]NHZ99555.1 hypothetical protein [Massilia sp. CCM 8734]